MTPAGASGQASVATTSAADAADSAGDPGWPAAPYGRRSYARHARSLSARRMRQRFVTLAVVAAVAATLAVAAGPITMRILSRPAAAPLLAAARARNEAAAWVSRWVGTGATVGCDAAMCAVLQAHHISSSRLWRLTTDTADPMNCDVIVATPVIRNRFGRRLATVYAPAKLASFGSGDSRVDIRSVDETGGTGRYWRAVRAGVAERRKLGRALLGNKNISVSAGAARVLAAGAADPSLLMSLPVLARLGPVTVLGFGSAGPGASRGMPALSVDLTAGRWPAATNPLTTGLAGVRRVRALGRIVRFLQAQRTPLKAASFHELTSLAGVGFIRIDYSAPAPLSTSSPPL
jgi:hypothetical protein